jgi:DNA-binding transcriptional ArsR family regulator
MKRDMELIRKILFAMEDENSNAEFTLQRKITGYTDDQIMYHLALLTEAGLIQAAGLDTYASGDDMFPIRLRWQGHEFLDAARNDDRWHKTEDAMRKTGGFSFDVAKQVLVALATQAAKGYLGLP